MCGLVTAVAAEAYKTTAEEGRKFSRKYQEQFPRYKDFTEQRECWRIGDNGVGRSGILRRGVVCRFSTPTIKTRGGKYCRLLLVAVKDKRPEGQLIASDVDQFSFEELWRDPAWCEREPDAPAPPKPQGAKKLLSGS